MVCRAALQGLLSALAADAASDVAAVADAASRVQLLAMSRDTQGAAAQALQQQAQG